jgi:hypothetical protein
MMSVMGRGWGGFSVENLASRGKVTGANMTKYYVRKTEDAQILGPFTVEQIRDMLTHGALDGDSLGLVAREQDLKKVAESDRNDWVRVADVPGIAGRFRGHRARKRNLLIAAAAITAAFLFSLILGFCQVIGSGS